MAFDGVSALPIGKLPRRLRTTLARVSEALNADRAEVAELLVLHQARRAEQGLATRYPDSRTGAYLTDVLTRIAAHPGVLERGF